MTQLTTNDIDTLRDGLTGEVLTPGGEGYDDARRVWNAEIDRRPAVIARCLTAADVAASVTFGAEHGLEIAVRSGAHGVSGHAVVDDGLMIDLSRMNAVTVDPEARRARVQGGALLGDLVQAAQEHALATPVGAINHTGVGGLTLGGGMGWLTRKHGLSIDNLLSCQVVTADSQVLRAAEDSHPDLFWALRGGGGNFGVVTEFEFALHPVGPVIHFALLFWPLERGPEFLRAAREVVGSLPSETNVIFGGVNAPPAPFVPEEHHHAPGYAMLIAGFGSEEEHLGVVNRMRALVPPLVDFVSPLPYFALQGLLDEANAWGLYDYDKGLYLDELTDDVIDVITTRLPEKTSPGSVMLFYRLDQAYSDVPDDATAFSGTRSPCYSCFVIAVCESPEVLERDRAWVRRFHADLEALSTRDGTYVNALPGVVVDQSRVRAAYGKEKYDRLAEIKQLYDPTNLFRRNANILPAAAPPR